MSESTALALRESTEVEIRSEEAEGEVIGSRIDRPITYEPPYEVQLPDPDTDKWNNHGRLWLALEGVTEVLQIRINRKRRKRRIGLLWNFSAD